MRARARVCGSGVAVVAVVAVVSGRRVHVSLRLLLILRSARLTPLHGHIPTARHHSAHAAP